MSWLPILLIGLGGFLIGGVVSFWNKSRVAAVVLAVFSAGCIAGYLRATLGTEPENDAFLAAGAAIGAGRVLETDRETS